MKKIAIVVFVSLSIMSCGKNNSTLPGMEGKWQLSAIFIQTTGAGSWHAEDSIPPDFIQFNHDGTLSMSPYVSTLFNSPIKYQVDNDTTMIFIYPNGANAVYGDNIFHFQLMDTILLITPPSMELVIEKFTRIQ